jgi:hypothetical protein
LVTRNGNRVYEYLAILLMVSVSMTGALTNSVPSFKLAGVTGEFVPMASAMEVGTLVKHVGDVVHFGVKVKNTGEIEAGYIVVVKWKEHGTEDWETGGLEDAWLDPAQYGEFTIGFVECSEWMVGKYFDVKFTLYQAETERVLDMKEISEAWVVEAYEVLGTLSNYWVG